MIPRTYGIRRPGGDGRSRGGDRLQDIRKTSIGNSREFLVIIINHRKFKVKSRGLSSLSVIFILSCPFGWRHIFEWPRLRSQGDGFSSGPRTESTLSIRICMCIWTFVVELSPVNNSGAGHITMHWLRSSIHLCNCSATERIASRRMDIRRATVSSIHV